MKHRGVVTLAALSTDDVRFLVDKTCRLSVCETVKQSLAGKTVGLWFQRPSTRTRTAFALAAFDLGARLLLYGPGDLQTNTGESLGDTGQVLAQYLDCLVVRSHETRDLEELSEYLPVINALTEQEHPTQAIADIATVVQEFGRLNEIHILFLGEGGNIAKTLCLAASCFHGLELTVATPYQFGLEEHFVKAVENRCRETGAVVRQIHDMDSARSCFDVVYTTRWLSMGQEKPVEGWRKYFEPFAVTGAFMARVSKAGTIFLHDLPAQRGEEVTNEILDGSQSRVLSQARNKLFAAMATLEWVLVGE